MRTLLKLSIGIICACTLAAEPSVTPWPPATQTAKPWTRWWWPGSAVEREQLRAQLEALARAGVGGVEITPIYGARGSESRDVEFLSPRWAELLEFTASEAKRLGLGIDMATGTGWPFGGPEVSVAQGSGTLVLVDGRLAGKPTSMKVKRAAPGGAGLVLDPYSTDALGSYLDRFTRALQGLPRGALRAQFHDSFEYYNAGWSPLLAQEFQRLNGYDIQVNARELMGEVPLDADILGRLKGDYRRTLAKMHLDYVNAWVAWSHAQGFTARNQAHGAPGNLLDLYAAADIPETESYGMTPLPIPGFRAAADDVNPDPDPPGNLIARFASSAAHVSGRPLASSETLTWLRENFREAPWAAKPQIDRLFTAGINHIFYHGLSYTAADAPWPGWYFYASTQLNPNNPLWQDYAALNTYVTRVQTVLQSGRADNDILLYWPFDDLVDQPEGLMRQYGVHDNAWLTGTSAGRMALALLGAGYSFDFVSDAQLDALDVQGAQLVAPGGRYRVIVVPATRRMSVATLRRLQALQKAGAPLVFESLPEDVPGFADLPGRRAELAALVAEPALRASQGNVIERLAALEARREGAAAAGLLFIRRAREDGHDYFLVNQGASPFDGWLQLATPAATALLMDPDSGRAGIPEVRRGTGGNARVYLQLGSGESLLLRTQRNRPHPRGQVAWRYYARRSEGVTLSGEWQLEFVRGGPTLPAPQRMPSLKSWTELEDPALKAFAGTARYRIEFDLPHGGEWLLDLGDVREAARVTLNGQPVGDLWSLPFETRLWPRPRERGNVLEIEVTNLPANRIRDLDVRKFDWKVMKEINLVTLRYKPFDASNWELAPSGLLGPVRLVPLEDVRPR